MEDNVLGWKPATRRGYSGEGDRPWVAVWMLLLDRAMAAAGHGPERKARWRASLGSFLLEFHRHPGRLKPWEVRDYLFRTGEVGASESPRSLRIAMDSLEFFYTAVVARPALAEAARHPFDFGLGSLKAEKQAEADWIPA